MSEIVITQKGKRLNMAELRMRARRPMTARGDMQDTVKPQRFNPSQPLRIQGFMPSAAGVAEPVVPPVEVPPVSEKSLADFTGITIDETRHLKEKPEDPMGVVNDTLTDIMGDLEQYSPSRRRQRKS